MFRLGSRECFACQLDEAADSGDDDHERLLLQLRSREGAVWRCDRREVPERAPQLRPKGISRRCASLLLLPQSGGKELGFANSA